MHIICYVFAFVYPQNYPNSCRGPHGKSTFAQGVYIAELSKTSPLSAAIPALTKTLGAWDGHN